jgi:hypothetical protein
MVKWFGPRSQPTSLEDRKAHILVNTENPAEQGRVMERRNLNDMPDYSKLQ